MTTVTSPNPASDNAVRARVATSGSISILVTWSAPPPAYIVTPREVILVPTSPRTTTRRPGPELHDVGRRVLAEGPRPYQG
ncbi:MAG: hypothetical protein LC799_10040, partial [Actinobacteria bacterium]|nr:hypothetical protein [Actinomycetota bacterium]